MNYKLLSLIILVSGLVFLSTQQANAQIAIDHSGDYIALSNGTLAPYKLTQNSTQIKIESNQGSYIFNKNTCSLSFYNPGLISGNPVIGSDVYAVKAELNGTTTWNNVSVINNAACTTNVITSGNDITIQSTKSVVGAGVFQINYTKKASQNLKLSFMATNQNPAWTNYHIGMTETIQVPQTVTLGNQTYDLSLYNNTSLNRNWITNHWAQLLTLSPKIHYYMGLGWNNVNDITIHWIGGKAYLDLDYTFNTPILQPGHTILVDPAIVTDNIGSPTSWSASTNATQTLTVTVASNTNRILIVGIANGKGVSGDGSIASVKIGSSAFTNATQGYSVIAGTPISSSIWYYVNPPVGTYHVTITPTNVGIANYGGASYYSLYNVNQTSPIGVTNKTSVATATTPISLNLTPTKTNSWLIDNLGATDSNGSPSGNGNRVQAWANSGTLTSGVGESASQYYTTPSIGSKNAMTWSSWGPTPQGAWDVGIELRATVNSPNTPTLTHANTLNSTAIKADWPSQTGATFYLINYTSPATGTSWTQLNVTTLTKTINGLTPGTQYALKLAAGNSTGTSGFTSIKSNYTFTTAPTSPSTSSITASSALFSWTNPSGNMTGGFKAFKVRANLSNFTLAFTTSNSTSHGTVTGLAGNSKYTLQVVSRYATGTNYSGTSVNSTTTSFFTLPNSPTSLTATQTVALTAHLSWIAPTDNGTVLGYKIEQSTNGGSSWTTQIANTGNTTQSADIVESVGGKYSFRVSTIKYGGTSSPSNTATIELYGTVFVTARKADNATMITGNIIQSNATSKNNFFPLIFGTTAGINGLTENQNFSAKDASTLFVTKKQYNVNATTLINLFLVTYDYYVDCPSDGVGTDFEVFTNSTDGHRISSFLKPVCYSNNTMTWNATFTANGNSAQSYTSSIRIQVLNNTFGANPSLITANGTTIPSSYVAPWIISNSFTVGNGLQSKIILFKANMALNPAFIPINFTVGGLNVTGSNTNTQPIIITSTKTGANTTVVFTYPTTYTLAVTTKYQMENQTKTFTGLTRTTIDAGHVASSITFKNSSNDIIKLTARDINSNNNANYSLVQSGNSIPIIQTIQNFRLGTYGTTGQLGAIDLITLIVLIFAMIGLNRVNESVGLVFYLIVMGGLSVYSIVSWPVVMASGIAMIALMIIGSTKKLPYS